MTQQQNFSAQPSSAEWPIAAALLQFPAATTGGEPISEASPEAWHDALSALAYEGFRHVELSCRWVDILRQSPPRIQRLADVCSSLELSIAGYLVAGRTVVDGKQETIDYTLHSIDAAAALGAKVVCLGLHPPIGRRPGGAEWFWNEGSPVPDPDPSARDRVVSIYRTFAKRAEDAGVGLTIEMYPGTYVGSAQAAVDFISDVGHPALGLNPDLGNIVRVQDTVEDWQHVVELTLPITNYWHVKSYSRSELPDRSGFITNPTSLELGVINYRTAIDYAISVGFAGTIVAEHYGGDGLGVSATNATYLRRLLRHALREPL